MKFKLSAIVSAAALLVCAVAPNAASAATNFALSSMGASFVSGSSVIAQGTFGLTMNYSQMQANLITNTPSPSISNGDTRYIFDNDDRDATLEINLGQVRQIDTVGAIGTLLVDRPLIGPFSAEVSTDGFTFNAFGSPLTLTGSSTNPLLISDVLQGVQYIRYHFGNSGNYYGSGGSGVDQLLAEGPSGVPEPAEWALLVVGVASVGAAARSRRAKAVAA